MESKAERREIQKIIHADHNNPHHVLGMHQITLDGKKRLIVRVYIPGAKAIHIIDANKKDMSFKMDETEYAGYFQCIIPRRRKVFQYLLACEAYDGTSWCIYDPYAFAPTLSDLDLHLFCEGTHYHIYKKLGAHLDIIQGVGGTRFAVWAPHAKRISVIGDFNQWDGKRHAMRLHPESGVWEIFIPGVAAGDMYKFEIKTQNDIILMKSDPYASFHEVRPHHAAIVYNLDEYNWNDAQWIEKREKQDMDRSPMSIYELHLGSWRRKEGDRFLTYRDMADQLTEYIKQMGYTHVEIMGAMEHPYDGSWGYQVTGYFAPTSRFGEPDDFRYLVDQLHQNNIGVILDWVPAHFPRDAYGLEKFDGTALYEYADTRKGEHPQWGTLIFDYGRMEVKLFLIASAIKWCEVFHIDGLRVDAVASMLYLDYGKEESGGWLPNQYGGRENLEAVEFIKHMNAVLHGRFPGVITIAEESTSWPHVTKPVEQGGLGFDFKWNMGWMNDFLSYMKLDPIHRKYHQQKITFSFMYAFSENFIQVLSHDEVVHEKSSMIGKMPGDEWQRFANLRVAYGYMYTHPGKKMLFMGSEFAQYSEWNEARSLDWHLLEYEPHTQMQAYVKDLNALYLNQPALWERDWTSEGFEWIDCDNDNDSVIVFYRKGNEWEDHMIIICNFTPQAHKGYRIGVQEVGEYQEIFNSDSEKYGGSGMTNDTLKSEDVPWHKREQSILVEVAPLGISVLKWNKIQ